MYNSIIIGPSILNALLIIIFGGLYKNLSFYITGKENYQYSNDHSQSLIKKLYIFAFVNSYYSPFFVAFTTQKFHLVTSTLFGIVLAQTIGINTGESLTYRFTVGFKIKTIQNSDQYKAVME